MLFLDIHVGRACGDHGAISFRGIQDTGCDVSVVAALVDIMENGKHCVSELFLVVAALVDIMEHGQHCVSELFTVNTYDHDRTNELIQVRRGSIFSMGSRSPKRGGGSLPPAAALMGRGSAMEESRIGPFAVPSRSSVLVAAVGGPPLRSSRRFVEGRLLMQSLSRLKARPGFVG